ncbi:hypothetical protein MFRU_047g00440 [Monilinia fructicola]|uniref:Uncharacterized protein n=1 Tax=Monilinia fructicola TaxID=38448 RepID=A0A5M9JHU8_MONFR|nr:hypothetical protein EYC84_000697 [Monilinia fructicola]KAG4025980.1 hypothetical protein MFRU_047g00440 [Monilinia fructicola]
MENTPFELRPQGQNYPLTLGERLAHADNYRIDHETLEKTRESIQKFYRSSFASAHTGDHMNCESCIGMNRQMRKAYQDWYLSDEQDRWYSKLFDYKAELQSMFDQPTVHSLANIHKRVDQEFRAHLKKDLCAYIPGDSEDVTEFKDRTAMELDGGRDIPKILTAYLTEQIKSCPHPDQVDFILRLNDTTTNQERIPIFISYYCSPLDSDSANVRNFKSKYIRMFENGDPHDEVVAAMRKESAHSKEVEIAQLRRRLNELNLAQSAQLKAKAKKAEKDTLKYQRHQQVARESKAFCSYDGCDEDVDLTVPDGALQCVLCDWIASKVPEDESHKRYYYCCPDHALLDHDAHEQNDHFCLSAHWKDSCLSQIGAIGSETYDGMGLCKVCMISGHKAFFCSEECYEKNYDQHAAEWHTDENAQNSLEVFSMPDNFVIEDIGNDPGLESGEVEDTEMKDV